MAQTITKNLKRFDFFEGLPDEAINELAQKIEEVSLKKDEVLFRKGDEGDAMYILRTGWVKLTSENKDGSEVVLNQVGPGSIIGEMAILDKEPRSASVIALSEVELLKLSNEEFNSVLQKQPSVALQLTRNMSKRLRFATTYIENAIEWSKRIAAGDYSWVEEQKRIAHATIVGNAQPDKDRANRFLVTFFRMVEDIKAREDDLKEQLMQLKIEIDQTKRRRDVSELASSDFFKNLQESKKPRGSEEASGTKE